MTTLITTLPHTLDTQLYRRIVGGGSSSCLTVCVTYRNGIPRLRESSQLSLCFGTMSVRLAIVFAVLAVYESLALMPSGWTVVNPTSQGDAAFGISIMYCKWQGSAFVDCNSGHSFSGAANFDTAGTTLVNDYELRIPFTTPYLADPVCSLEFEGGTRSYWHTLTSTKDAVHVISYSYQFPNTVPEDYSLINYFMSLKCFGAMSSSAAGSQNVMSPTDGLKS